MAECPVCGAQINLAPNAEKGEIMSCADCGSELEVTGKDSVQEAPRKRKTGANDRGPNPLRSIEHESWFLTFHPESRRELLIDEFRTRPESSWRRSTTGNASSTSTRMTSALTWSSNAVSTTPVRSTPSRSSMTSESHGQHL